MSSSSWIDTSGRRPSLRAVAVLTGMASTVIYGWFVGYIAFLDSAWSGITGTLNDAQTWITQLFLSIPQIGVSAMDAAAQSNAEFLASFGLLGIVIGFAEGLLIFVLIVLTVRGAIRIIRRGI